MTALAVGKAEITSESSFTGVAGRARLPARVDEVLRRGSRTNLSRLRCARS